jgi:hypothetical protein
MKERVWILLAAILVAVFVVYLLPAIPQSEAYHSFADKRAFLGVPNFLNVVSNALFLLVGVPGMWFAIRAGHRANVFLDSRERWPYFAFFVGVTLTAFGSAWYHLNRNDHTLVWDRIPMAIGFMALVAALIAERIDVATGLWFLLPLITIGIGSVVYWDITQSRGHGDLRPYAIAQFGSLLVLLLLIVLGLYGGAKIFEAADRVVFSAGQIVSGHTIKHVFAALSAYWILHMLRLRAPVSDASLRASASGAKALA